MLPDNQDLRGFFQNASPPIKLKLIGIALLAVAAVMVASYSIYHIWQWQTRWAQTNDPHRAVAAKEKKVEEEIPEGSPLLRYELKGVAAPMTSRDGRRNGTIQFTLLLQMPNKEAKHWMEMHRAKLLSLIFEVSNRFHFENFEDKRGIETFKTEIQKTYQEAFTAHAPSELFVKDWVIQ